MTHVSAELVHDIVDEHAHICNDCPPAARQSVIDEHGFRSLIRQLAGMLGETRQTARTTAVVTELERHKYLGCGECACGAEVTQPHSPNWETHRAEAILAMIDAYSGSRP